MCRWLTLWLTLLIVLSSVRKKTRREGKDLDARKGKIHGTQYCNVLMVTKMGCISSVLLCQIFLHHTGTCISTVGKQSLWYLSFVHTSHVSLPIRTAQNLEPFQ